MNDTLLLGQKELTSRQTPPTADGVSQWIWGDILANGEAIVRYHEGGSELPWWEERGTGKQYRKDLVPVCAPIQSYS